MGQGVAEQLVGSAKELGPGSVRGVGRWAVLNVDGRRYAVSRRCRHLRADLAGGHIDEWNKSQSVKNDLGTPEPAC